MNNLFPQYQIQTCAEGKGWETVFFDPDLPVMRLRFDYQLQVQTTSTQVRLLGLSGELLDYGTGKAIDKPKKKTTVEA